jgi:hypothetical protein
MLPLIPAAGPAADNLAQVQAGFSGPRELAFSDVKIAVIILLAIVAAGIAAALIRRLMRARARGSGWSSITSQSHIWDIVTRAVSRMANVTLDLYMPDRSFRYKGVMEALEGDSAVAVTISEAPNTEIDFRDTPGVVHLAFRPSLKEPMEHYQFTTRIIDSRYVRVQGGFREAQLLVPLPKVLTSAQRRSFLRLDPKEPYEFKCVLNSVPDDDFPGLDRLERVTEGTVQDVSIGGCQLRVEPPAAVRETQRFVGVIELPTSDLGVDIRNPVLVILMHVLSKETVDEEDTRQNPASVIRMRFLGRYLQDPIQKNWIYRGVTAAAIDELAHWLQAYQRFLIQKRSHMLPSDLAKLRPPNMFPSTPPERPPLKDA